MHLPVQDLQPDGVSPPEGQHGGPAGGLVAEAVRPGGDLLQTVPHQAQLEVVPLTAEGGPGEGVGPGGRSSELSCSPVPAAPEVSDGPLQDYLPSPGAAEAGSGGSEGHWAGEPSYVSLLVLLGGAGVISLTRHRVGHQGKVARSQLGSSHAGQQKCGGEGGRHLGHLQSGDPSTEPQQGLAFVIW